MNPYTHISESCNTHMAINCGTFIHGRLHASNADPVDLFNPATGEVARRIIPSTPDDAANAILDCRMAQPAWAATEPKQRARILLKLADLVEEHADELTALEVAETGKPVSFMRFGEIVTAADNIRYFAGALRALDGTGAGVFAKGFTSVLTRRPVGVVAGIAPWNFPLIMGIWKAVPAIAGGNAVVVKAAPQTPSTTLRLAELAIEAGLPAGVFNVVTGGADTGRMLASHGSVDMVSVTGSSTTGRLVMEQAAQSMKRVHLELGGKAPALLLDDADLAAAASAIVFGANYNTGQDCTSATRAYVPRHLHDAFVDAALAEMDKLVVGDPLDPATTVGPLISPSHRDRVHGFVERAVAAGARLAGGGRIPDGQRYFYPPTLVTGAAQDSEIVQDEIFGPVLVVVPYDGGDDEAIRLANNSRFGLASSVWSMDGGRALRTAHQLDVGVTWINSHLPITSEMPHGGVKGSGFGKDMSAEVIAEYTVSRHIMIRHSPLDEPLAWG
ncbi:aldehyde dehydrogenase family protein [Rhizobium sp. KVB221]|uniref:Aldehyde dehydrogenase family protein n=1 Tax=Rhizobium setariae TaxID=2801340 RepID=A0A937CM27_9HYPH|nr:aldehyde dehydrogenase family protein [Rhizobium setariae]